MFVQRNTKSSLVLALEEHMPAMWRFALSLCGKADVADDLVQATCLRALEKQHQIKTFDRIDAWLMTILRSIWLNELRSATIRKAQSLSTVPEFEMISDIADSETNIYASQVFNKVMDLPEAQRGTVLLVFVEGYSYREAAEILEVPIGTIMSRLSAAREKLRAVIGIDDVPARPAKRSEAL